jgi:signal transduction histidine kinase
MRSIRLSLVVYFLALLTAAMGVASLLAYRSSQRTLGEKQRAMVKQIEGQYDQRVREERRNFDKDLEAQAIGLAGRLSIEIDWGRPRRFHQLQFLGALSAGLTPSGYVSAAPWLIQAPYLGQGQWGRRPELRSTAFANEIWRTFYETWRGLTMNIRLNESDLVLPTTRNPIRHFQLDTNGWGRARPSHSLGDLRFPAPGDFGEGKLIHTEADNFELTPGQTFRRVRVKASRPRSVFVPAWGARPSPPPVRVLRIVTPWIPLPTLPLPSGTRNEPTLAVVVQVAADPQPLEEKIAAFGNVRNQERAELEEQSALTLRQLRDRLLVISGLTFGATVLGTLGLVWLGLLPLRRLSDAVSKVSTRDFRLGLDGAHMPAELRPIEDRLTETLELLKRAFAREKQATADISHELRTPLAAMLTTIDLALRKPRSPEQYRDLFGDCRASAKAMNQIVERLLTLARLDAGVDRLRPQAVNVGELAEQCATVVRPLAEARGLKLAVYHPEGATEDNQGEARLTTDPDKLREVLNNLLHNAIQYNRPEGEIDVTVARSNGHVELAVRDTGIGIPPQARDLIFERFYRADPSRTGDGLNAGLGLAIVKEYVELMGGRIRVESEEGRGSTFRIELPVESSAKVPA